VPKGLSEHRVRDLPDLKVRKEMPEAMGLMALRAQRERMDYKVFKVP
jgi:hypothetical protein